MSWAKQMLVKPIARVPSISSNVKSVNSVLGRPCLGLAGLLPLFSGVHVLRAGVSPTPPLPFWCFFLAYNAFSLSHHAPASLPSSSPSKVRPHSNSSAPATALHFQGKMQPALLDPCITMIPFRRYRPARNQSTLILTPAWSTVF